MSKKFKINMQNIENLFANAKNEGISAASILENLQLSSSALSEWKKGKSCPTIEALIAMADYFNVSVDYLLCRESVEKKPTSEKKSAIKLPEDNDEIPYSDNPRDVMNKTKVAFVRKYDERNKHTFYLPVNTQCPICHHDNQPKPIDFQPFDQNKANQSCDMVGILLCTRCHHTYSVLYKEKSNLRTNYVDYVLKQELPVVDSCYTPYHSKVPDLPEAFNKPEFAKFRQAYEDLCWAKDYQIEGLVGMAYRRAIDFLIRDYFIAANVDYSGNKEADYLDCLIRAIDEKEIKTFAERVNWLANDYTHYIDEHPDCTIADIEEFFNIIVRVLSDNICYNKALKIQSKYQKRNNIVQQNEPIAVRGNNVPLTKIVEDYKHLFADNDFVKIAKVYDNAKIDTIKGILVGYFLATAKANGIDTFTLVGY